MQRVTDRQNGELSGQSATASDVPSSFAFPCVGDSDPAVGSICSVSTTANAVLPNIAREGYRAIWQLGQIEIYDGGDDGQASTPWDNQLFEVQGLFAP